MKRVLFTIVAGLFMSLPAMAQQTIPGGTVTAFAGAPSGSCSSLRLAVNTLNGDLYDCLSNAWHAVGGGGITGTLTATRVPFASGASTLTDSANLTYASSILTVSGGIEITGTGVGTVNAAPYNLYLHQTDDTAWPFIIDNATQGGTRFITGYVDASSGTVFLGLGTDSATIVAFNAAAEGHPTGSLGIESNVQTADIGFGSGTESIVPWHDNAQHLGRAAFRWNDLHIGTGASQFDGTVSIGGGTPIAKVISNTATLDFGNLAALGCEDLTITVTGAADGDQVNIAAPVAAYVSQTSTYTGFVSATDTVKVRYCALVSGDPPSSTFRAAVTKY